MCDIETILGKTTYTGIEFHGKVSEKIRMMNLKDQLVSIARLEDVVERYEREVWEYNLKLKQKEKPAKKPPEKQSVREHLRQLQEQGKQQSHKKKSFDRER